MSAHPIPVVDLFAGPGGLSEGFASLRTAGGAPCFDVRLSIEKDPVAHRTLELRSFVRAFGARIPDSYYDYLAGAIDRNELLSDRRFHEEASRAGHEAWHYTLAETSHREVSRRVSEALDRSDFWVLIGGPPCQAYSMAGRSRMRPVDPARFENDQRHFLYREYLRILADHAPPVFIMENVRGILSSTVQGKLIFGQILDDLSRPNGSSLRYRIVPLCEPADLFENSPESYLVRCERHGIPQARHRVILCGLREDLVGRPDYLVPQDHDEHIEHALADLPPLRSRVSREEDSPKRWLEVLRDACTQFERRGGARFDDVLGTMKESLKRARELSTAGAHFMPYTSPRGRPPVAVQRLRKWYKDSRMRGVTGHQTRLHMRWDLYRYFFAASYAATRGNISPRIRNFPRYLLPNHRNVDASPETVPFADRFRVQVRGAPSTTIVSHIAKDGHYYIHYDPAQCRSLTLREAARLQTFPDNYHFAGNRTEQFHQVGNAVPPLLAQQIAAVLWNFVVKTRIGSQRVCADAEFLRASNVI